MHPRCPSGSSAVAAASSPPSLRDSRSAGTAACAGASELTLTWLTRPARLHPGRFIVALVAIILTLYVALTGFHSLLMALAGIAAVFGSLTEAFFPVHHRISPSGVSTRCAWQMRQMTWESVRSARIGADGIHLSPLRHGARLGRIRGVRLRFDGGNRQKVTDAVRTFLKRDAQ